MKVEAFVTKINLPGDHKEIEGIEVECSRCGHTVQAYGTSPKSVRRCLASLREECPEGEENYYYADDGSDND